MTSSKEQSRLFSPLFDNKEPVIASSGTSVTFNFVDDDTDTASTFYFGLGSSGATSISLRPSSTCLVTHINGRALTDPMTVSTSGWTDKFIALTSITVETTADSASLKLFARGGK